MWEYYKYKPNTLKMHLLLFLSPQVFNNKAEIQQQSESAYVYNCIWSVTSVTPDSCLCEKQIQAKIFYAYSLNLMFKYTE